MKRVILESSDPTASHERYRALIKSQPGFAETHFRLARLLQRDGAMEEAYHEYILARDLDAHPMRCLSSFQEVYRQLAPRYGAILVDGQAVFHARHPLGLLDDYLFNDAMHPSFEGHVALAEAVLAGLKEAQAFGWPSSQPAPAIDLEECARHFDVTTVTWKQACRFAAGFYRATAPIRLDPAERSLKASRYDSLIQELNGGSFPGRLDFPGIGVESVSTRVRRGTGK